MKSFIKRLLAVIVFSIIILIANVSFAGTLSEVDDLSGLDENKYPQMKNMLQNIKNNNSNYHFQIYYTGIDWTEAITMEYQGHGHSPKNLVSAKYTTAYQRHGKWFCPICGQSTFDSGLYCASKATIEYMMDPRNSLEGSSIFQFKNLEYADVSASDIQNVISNKYSSYSYINNGTAINAMQTASTNLNLNGFSILAKIVNEQGAGNSVLVKGTGYNGNYVGYYNFFNVGAYGNGVGTILMNGLKYAYNHGWNSVTSSIIGGSEFYKNSYIGKGQNTLYYQRFNVIYTQALFSHQYQQDVMGAETSATLMKDYYSKSGKLGIDQYFIIPVYENMPTAKCSRPSTEENDSVQYESTTVKINNLAVRAAPESSKIIGYLNAGESIKIVEKATYASSDGNYWDAIVTDTDGTYGYVERYYIGNALPNYVFDAEYYYNKYPDLQAAFGMDEEALLNHFINFGINEGRVASYNFDVAYYINLYPDIKNAFGTNYQAALNHYITCGLKEGRTASFEFDVKYYLEKNADLLNAFGKNGYELAYKHFKDCGMKEGRRVSIILDIKYYLKSNSDIAHAFGNENYVGAFNHFICSGVNEYRNCSSEYDGLYYKSTNEKFANYTPLELMSYYITYGINNGDSAVAGKNIEQKETAQEEISKEENEKIEEDDEIEYEIFSNETFNLPKYIFDANYYYYTNGDLQAAFGKNAQLLYNHFITCGIREGRAASEIFDVKYYLNSNQDLIDAFGANNYEAAFQHFWVCGIREGRKSSSKFDIRYYLSNNGDLINAFGENNYRAAYQHYVDCGKKEGRECYEK